MEKIWIGLWILTLCVIGMGSLLADIIIGSPEENMEHMMSQIRTLKQEQKNHMIQSDGPDDDYDFSDSQNYPKTFDEDSLFNIS
jgi:hypothetical protein